MLATHPPYPREFREEAVRLVKAGEKAKSQIALDLRGSAYSRRVEGGPWTPGRSQGRGPFDAKSWYRGHIAPVQTAQHDDPRSADAAGA